MTDPTDRVLTEQEIGGYAESWRDNESVMKLITSHRTLHHRHRQLLRRVRELEPQTGVREICRGHGVWPSSSLGGHAT